ncbi:MULTISPECIES: HtaA domain-containing protein [Streptomyces]|uniref:HtaA domain-containing protein n=1 Tax=Streptomyces edwardsiae TaxID=3075527 RepID=A0ABU2QRW0_9ACTN|nr:MULTISPECIES: HtaA domain-containing protein [unclassified Streptomyces]MDT0405735.1 HtaA domain-containing protein [Streptomyces sp. DSM 41635]
MAKRPVAAAVTGGALLALLCPGAATAQDGPAPLPHEVSGGYAALRLENRDMTLDVTEPAVQGAADRSWFPVTGGGADDETGDADLELGGTAMLTAPFGTLPLAGLRLELDGGTGSLSARTVVAGRALDRVLAEVTSDSGPVVRASGVTWNGLRASLSSEGAALLSEWSGTEFTAGDAFGTLDVTVGTGGGATPVPDAPPATPPPASRPAEKSREEPVRRDTTATATVARATLAPGTGQQVTGTGFEPGGIVLVSIDQDTRYQVVADEQGGVTKDFPMYDGAFEGVHTVELYTVSGGRRAVAEFGVRAPE